MSQSVTIKSNKYGINLVLDADMSFADLIKAVVEKFKASANFFKNAKLAISFEGRHLSDDEQQQIIAAIEENTTIEILCIVESGTEQEAIMKEQVEAFNEAVQKQCENVATVSVPEQFYRASAEARPDSSQSNHQSESESAACQVQIQNSSCHLYIRREHCPLMHQE